MVNDDRFLLYVRRKPSNPYRNGASVSVLVGSSQMREGIRWEARHRFIACDGRGRLVRSHQLLDHWLERGGQR
jgi:hypothetical protein